MQVDQRNSTISHKEQSAEFTVNFLKDQLRFTNDRLKRATAELEEKEVLIQKLEHEKRDI